MGLFLFLAWVVFTLFGVALTLKVEKNFRYRITPFLGSFLINCSIRGVIFTPEKEFFKLLFEIKITPAKNNSAVRSWINPTRGIIITPWKLLCGKEQSRWRLKERKFTAGQARVKAAVISVSLQICESLNLFKTGFACSKLIYSPMTMDDGSIKEANGSSQWFLSLRSVVSSLEEPLLRGKAG